MNEDAEIKAKIAAISGQINKHKQPQPDPFNPAPRYHQPRQYPSHHPHGRWSPYARGGQPAYPQLHKNRTLVLGGNQSSPPRAAETTHKGEETLADPNASATFVSTHSVGKSQFMTPDAYARQQKQTQVNKETARAAKRQRIDDKERATLMHHAAATSTPDNRELVISGIRFQLRDDGSKLIRILDPIYAATQTPKRATVAGINFHRTKHGNFVRASAVHGLVRYRYYDTNSLTGNDLRSTYHRNANHKEKPRCEHFTKHGNCPFGPSCKFTHDPDKVAICKTFLRSGSCPDGDSCDLSHVSSYHRAPACLHFLRNNCSKDACPYPHIHVEVSPSAHVCRPFASLGYCDAGEDCAKRHVFECPDYSNKGFCANRESGKCTLPHIDRAGVLRKAAARQAKSGFADESDVSSDEDDKDGSSGFDDIDSDAAEDVIMGGVDNDHALTQQQDFIALT